MSCQGGCRCGCIRYRVTGAASEQFFCHCESCRRSAGASPVPWATFNVAHFALDEGELVQYTSSPDVQRGFCRACGTALTYRHATRPLEIDVMVLSLDDPTAFTPRYHLWVSDRLPWIVIGDALPRYPQEKA